MVSYCTVKGDSRIEEEEAVDACTRVDGVRILWFIYGVPPVFSHPRHTRHLYPSPPQLHLWPFRTVVLMSSHFSEDHLQSRMFEIPQPHIAHLFVPSTLFDLLRSSCFCVCFDVTSCTISPVFSSVCKPIARAYTISFGFTSAPGELCVLEISRDECVPLIGGKVRGMTMTVSLTIQRMYRAPMSICYTMREQVPST